ncbi:unnamed protein product [Tuber melanosporum]|uniref:(Perigord truffle) hypothetical protein n=1 Tax=Tuber melanosporum (strain Mel28) TaxID=656061 RepID=D5G6U1_TUBMM|nr:uncharacterized protein GSTUM_00002111001 [Tuber melanosporum]CAZ80232.1 unnamed protein product [Tuber melanosporum]
MPKEHKRDPHTKSPVVGPTPPLPASVEESYRQKCIDLKKRIKEIETSNDVLVVRMQRAERGIQRMRLERAFLLQQLEQRTDPRVDDSEGSPSPPPTPKDKPLRTKRARKDPPPMDSPMRQASPSPSRDGQDYTFVSTAFNSAPTDNADSPGPSQLSIPPSVPPKTGKGSRSKGGPKRPPNAYMIFCEKERDAVRERESKKDGFDMHKALAQAWRDLKAEGQKPYFNEYEKNREKYLEKVNDLKTDADKSSIGGNGGSWKRGGRAVSAASSVVAASFEAPLSPAPGSINDDEQEDAAVQSQGDGSGGGFTAVNR